MVYRIVITCYITVWLVLSTLWNPVVFGFIWPVFMTSWAFFVLCLHLWMGTILTVSHAITHRHFLWEAPPLHRSMGTPIALNESSGDFPEDGQEDVGFVMPSDRLPWFCKLSWVLFSIIANGAIIVSVVFFAALYPQAYPDGDFPSVEDFNLHAVNTIVVIIELFLSALPVRILHMVFTMMFGLAYTGMSLLLYFFYKKTAIYPEVLDWNYPVKTGLVVGGLILVAVPVVQLVLFSLYKLRVFIFRKLYDFD